MPETAPYSTPEFNNRPEQDADLLLALGPELSSRNMFCLHGIALDSVGGNSSLAENTTLEERFRIAVEDNPSLSTVVHTDSAMTSKAPLWSSVGVVIGGGRIQAASPGDMSSVMLDGGQRRVPEQSADDVKQALDKIVANDTKYPDYPLHNEVVVADPVVAALYFKDTAGLMPHQINKQHTVADYNTVPELIRGLGVKFGLPIFAVRTSGVYEVKESDPAGKYKFSKDTAPRVHAAEVVTGRLFQAIPFAGSLATRGEIKTENNVNQAA